MISIHTFRPHITLILGALILSSSATHANQSANTTKRFLAGGVSDGGGSAVVCRNQGGAVSSARLLDLFEAEAIYGRTPNVDTKLNTQELAIALAKSVDRGGPGYDTTGVTTSTDSSGKTTRSLSLLGGQIKLNSLETSIQYFDSVKRILPYGVALKPINDYKSPIVPTGCEVEQLAAFNDASGRLLIVGEIWNKLDKTNQAALLLHEVLYRQLRSQGEVSSDRTRYTVGLAVSGFQFSWGRLKLPKNIKLCFSDDPEMSFRFAAYESGTSVVLNFMQIDGIQTLSEDMLILPRDTSPFADPATTMGSVYANNTTSDINDRPAIAFSVYPETQGILSMTIVRLNSPTGKSRQFPVICNPYTVPDLEVLP